MVQEKSKIPKSSRNYVYDIFSFFPFVFLLFTGIVVLRYHGGYPYVLETFGIDGYQWLWIHRITALAIIPIILVHLLLHLHWLKMLLKLSLKGKNSGMNLTLFIIFLLSAITALLAWFVFGVSPVAEILREVHNKLGLLLIFFFVIHLSNYFKWFLHMTRKILGKKKTDQNDNQV